MEIIEFKNQFESMEKLPLFEVEVLNNFSQELEFITFDISIKGKKFKATHIPFNEVEENCNLIAFESINIDTDFSLDENLESLHEECINAIMQSEFFELI